MSHYIITLIIICTCEVAMYRFNTSQVADCDVITSATIFNKCGFTITLRRHERYILKLSLEFPLLSDLQHLALCMECSFAIIVLDICFFSGSSL